MSQQPFSPSTIATDAKAPTLKRLRQMARLLDRAIVIPGTEVGIGLDPILGLVPGGGDFLGVMLSAYIVLESARLGAPRSTLSRMVLNIIVDGVVGAVPVFGDFFDFAWTANTRNIRLLEDYLKFPGQRRKADWWFIAGIMLVLLVLAIALVALPVILLRAFVSLFAGG
ncbi:DUF4112 domain-containing protein [Calothrix sp. UHCC 0171]|uniref:DUF4112 domain-containing protein n=1 Tax=Calothrix sp. UHCC 0171 TaxID=3110245 RepID=UPI002B21DDA7|nr:DUF4112 domain-containing protein [Calothrix sp. UHCC 0171]MEA5569550.1 DUF4112 domain-containing protein [Calothrix sp. UHCC 0171]